MDVSQACVGRESFRCGLKWGIASNGHLAHSATGAFCFLATSTQRVDIKHAYLDLERRWGG